MQGGAKALGMELLGLEEGSDEVSFDSPACLRHSMVLKWSLV